MPKLMIPHDANKSRNPFLQARGKPDEDDRTICSVRAPLRSLSNTSNCGRASDSIFPTSLAALF